VVEQIAERFKQGCFDHIATVEKVLLQVAAGLSVSLELKELEKVSDDFDYDMLEAQQMILRSLFETSVPTTVSDVASVLQSTEGAALMLSEVVRFVTLCLILPATSASAERSFSALRRLKTFIRSTVGQPRLNHVLLLHCHQDCLDKFDLRLVAQKFI
jgi:hAT family C-terminal dimerisation region